VSDRKATPPELPVFVTEDNRARLMVIYGDALRRWSVPYEAFFVETRYGGTHVIGSSDPGAPPVVMTHPMGVGASCGQWRPKSSTLFFRGRWRLRPIAVTLCPDSVEEPAMESGGAEWRRRVLLRR
jgi:hypothetical protein